MYIVVVHRKCALPSDKDVGCGLKHGTHGVWAYGPGKQFLLCRGGVCCDDVRYVPRHLPRRYVLCNAGARLALDAVFHPSLAVPHIPS
jgi:hypothetical protein